MAVFEYKGIDASGQAVAGSVEALDRKAAIANLARKGCFARQVFEKDAHTASAVTKTVTAVSGFSRGIKSKDIVAMTSQLATALEAGLPMFTALEILRSQQKREGMLRLLDELTQAVSSGQSLSEAMGRHPELFSSLYISMVRVGETGGILEKTMQQLVSLMGREEKIRSNLLSASAYPLFVLFAGLMSMVIILVWVLPKIISTIGIELSMLPFPTRLLMGLSNFLLSFGWLAAIAIGFGLYGFSKWKKSPAGRIAWDKVKLKLPLFGNVIRSLAVGRFARTLGSLSSSGVTILEALLVVRGTLGNEALAVPIDNVSAKIKTGANLADSLEESGLFPALLVQISAMGEQTGQLDQLLLKAANTFDDEADAVMARFLAVFPAVMILLLAVMIFFIVMATLLPIMTMDMSVM